MRYGAELLRAFACALSRSVSHLADDEPLYSQVGDALPLPASVLLSLRVAPLGMEGDALLLLADEKSDLSGAFAAATAAGLPIKVRNASGAQLAKALERLHALELGSRAGRAGAMVLHEPPAPYLEGPRQHYVEALLARALAAGASDVHIQPGPDGLSLRLRVDGHLREVERLPLAQAAALSAQVKVLARLSLAEKRLPQDGRFSIRLGGKDMDLRVNILPSIHGEALVIRLAEDEAPMELDTLGMPDAVRAPIEALLGRRGGMLLVGGPTGSGKTNTLYALLRAVCAEGRKIISVEDPVERLLPGVSQVPVEPGGMGFGEAIRAMLRHSPDLIMVGEVRDAQTAAAAAEAALTGHLVLASAHARDAVELAFRLMDLGVSRHLMSCVLELALTQRLVRLLCPACSRPGQPPAPLMRALGISEAEAVTCRLPLGCPRCGGSGHLGRRAIFGLVGMNAELRGLLCSGAGARALRAKAAELGMPDLAGSARALVLGGLCSAGEALAAASLADADGVDNISHTREAQS